MKGLILSLLFVLTIYACKGQVVVNSAILRNVFQIKHGLNTASGFRISLDSKDYLITARHVFSNSLTNKTPIAFEVLNDKGWVKMKATLLIHDNNSIDIAVLDLGTNQLMENPFDLQGEYFLSQECFFLGFPFGFKMDVGSLNSDFPLPFVKKGVLSAFVTDNLKVNQIFLDGHNNPGFSGGPVVVYNATSKNKILIVSVVSGYVNDNKTIKTPFGDITSSENSGIVVSYGFNHVLEIINHR